MPGPVMTVRDAHERTGSGIRKIGIWYYVPVVSGESRKMRGSDIVWHRGGNVYSEYTGKLDKKFKHRGPMMGPREKYLQTGDSPHKRKKK